MSMTITFTIPVDLEHAKIAIVKATIAHFNGDKRAAAKALGISLKTIYNKLEEDTEREKS